MRLRYAPKTLRMCTRGALSTDDLVPPHSPHVIFERMRYLNAILFVSAIWIFFGFLNFLFPQEVSAGAAENTSGWAWSDTIGWISFNSIHPLRQDGVLHDYGIPVVQSSDDAYHAPTGWPNYTHTDIIVYAGRPGSQITYGGWRWTKTGIPQGATINEAYVRVRNQTGTGGFDTDVAFQRTPNAPTFSAGSSPYNRWADRTPTVVTWNWLTAREDTTTFFGWSKTPSLRNSLQEVVNNLGVGQILDSVVLLEDGTKAPVGPNYHAWWSFDGDPDLAARLYIEWFLDANSNGVWDAGETGYSNITIQNFGVNVNPKIGASGFAGEFSGYAWSEAIGWINFNYNMSGPFPSAPNHGPLLDLTKDGIACGTGSTFDACGWARACSVFQSGCSGAFDPAAGWDGWIRLRGTATNGSPYGLSWDNPSSEIRGWAWGGGIDSNGDGTPEEGIGWINFNQKNWCDPDGNLQSNGGVGCPPAGQTLVKSAVVANLNVPPEARNLRELYGNYCSAPNNVVPVILKWDFFDENDFDTQGGAQVAIRVDSTQVLANPNHNSCPGASTTDADPNPLTGTCLSYGADSYVPSSNGYTILYYQSPSFGMNPYSWRVRLKDNKDLWGNWFPDPGYPYPWEELTNPAKSFSTIRHQYPDLSFTFSPASPIAGEKMTFSDSSTCYWTYNAGARNQSYLCRNANPQGRFNRYQWDFDGDKVWDCDSDPNEDGVVDNAACMGPQIQWEYASSQTVTVTLRITDRYLAANELPAKLNPAGAYCEAKASLGVIPKIIWEEISPF